jgi:hypothetical protein
MEEIKAKLRRWEEAERATGSENPFRPRGHLFPPCSSLLEC